jgi:hypothetical protein
MNQTAEKLASPLIDQLHGGKVPDTVLLAALGPSKHQLIEHQTGHQPDEGMMTVDEVWGVNAGANWLSGRVHYDQLFVLDYITGEAAKLPKYVALLEAWSRRHGKQVITSVANGRDWCVEFPLEAVYAKVRAYNPAPPYFHNSIPLILAYAWAIGVRRVYLWGIDYSYDGLQRREDDRANCEYWIGWCRALGMEIITSTQSTICNSNQGFRVYGYPPGAERHPQFDGERLYRTDTIDA